MTMKGNYSSRGDTGRTRAAGRATAANQPPRGRFSSTFWMVFGIAAYAAAAITGVATAVQSAEVRTYNQRLSDIQAVQDEHMTRHRLLLLERATFAGYFNVERVAREELGMGFPQEVVKVRR